MDLSSLQKPRVLVMMATYNGAQYISEQIESILSQIDVEVTLMICDDQSLDETARICESYSLEHENVSFSINKSNKGVAWNFMQMVCEANSERFDYFAFSDQDDYWLPNKLIHAIHSMPNQQNGCLYYSDVENVDKDLQQFKGGGREYSIFGEQSKSLELLLSCNWASGCTMVFDRKLCQLLQAHMPKSFPRIHDVWVHLVALSCATTVPDLESAFILRRISGTNEVGQRNFEQISYQRVLNILQLLFKKRTHNRLDTAKLLIECYKDEIYPKSLQIISSFIKGNSSLINRLKLACNPCYRMPTPLETIMLKLTIALGYL